MSAPQYQSPPIERLPGANADHAADLSHATALQRFLGGPPLAVAVRLLFVSLVVGALLVWFDIRPFDVFFAVRRLIDRLWNLGWDAVREVLDYVAAGAILVLPCWLVLRLMNFRGAR